ncbi:MAG: AAA family ATPase [Thermodesulfobacteriota bacterium]|nr:AAA family ATPase [Thermodesulfobacteriota bacterium]
MKGATIAISGKGGVGKTSLAALLVKKLSEVGSVLAIDADPDSNLPQALGVIVRKSIGYVRESIINAPARTKTIMTKEEFARLSLHEAIEEFPKFDIAVMGRSEGGGCYCFLNNIIRLIIDFRSEGYNFTVIDCHAGLEHLSRRTARGIDILIAVTEPTKNGMLTARRVIELSRELSIDIGKTMVVANKVSPEIRPSLDRTAKENGLEIDVYIPFEKEITNLSISGKSIVNLSGDSPICVAVDRVCEIILGTYQIVGTEARISEFF